MDFFVTLLHFFQKGGFMMYPIAIVLALSVAITIERWLFLSRVENENRKLWQEAAPLLANGDVATVEQIVSGSDTARSEEHTSELQSLMRSSYAVFCLKKKNITTQNSSIET